MSGGWSSAPRNARTTSRYDFPRLWPARSSGSTLAMDASVDGAAIRGAGNARSCTAGGHWHRPSRPNRSPNRSPSAWRSLPVRPPVSVPHPHHDRRATLASSHRRSPDATRTGAGEWSWYGPPVTWQVIRQQLVERADLRGRAFCPVFSDAVDTWLGGLLHEAAGGDTSDLALVAVGGYGRRELCPGSDLDLVLLHRNRKDITAMADAVWYPIWDGGARLDHSVRLPAEAIQAATDDLRVQLGLLDGRVVAGDPSVAAPVLADVADLWRRRAPNWFGAIVEQADERRHRRGDLAFLLEPDLKESHGGLRDADVITALARGSDLVSAQVDVASVGPARQRLLDIRVELHRCDGHVADRLVLQTQDDVAAALGIGDADALMATVAEAGRAIGWVADDTWRRLSAARFAGRPRRRWRRAGGQSAAPAEPRSRVEPGIVVRGAPDALERGDVRFDRSRHGEVALDPDGPTPDDVVLPLRLAAVAAERSLPIARDALGAVAAAMGPVPDPWPPQLRQALVRVLAAGTPAIAALEALDHYGILTRLVPEWQAVRNKPQRNAYHQFTVDRHLLEAAARAAPLALGSPRPDLLLVGTLLHDIGKGFPGDHTDVGQQIVATMARRMGFTAGDSETLVTMVRLHLLLPDVATRRDLDDPLTVTAVADAVGDSTTLGLLAGLTEADSLATGPSAWGPWKAGLVADLVQRVRSRLAGEPDRPPPVADVHERHVRLMGQARRLGRSVLVADGSDVTIVAEDRPGLLATAAGVLALFGLDVRSADVAATEGFAIERFVVEPSQGRWPDWTRVADDLEAALRGTLPLRRRLADRAQAYQGTKRPGLAHPVATRVTIDNQASSTATVVDVRTADGVGVLHRLTQAVFDCGLDVVAARASTLGDEVVDAFYLHDPAGRSKVVDPERLRTLEHRLIESSGSA